MLIGRELADLSVAVISLPVVTRVLPCSHIITTAVDNNLGKLIFFAICTCWYIGSALSNVMI